MTQANTDLAMRQAGEMVNVSDYMPVMDINHAIDRYNAVVDFTKRLMKIGRDYGTIPGTERKVRDGEPPSSSNHTLLKPGAEKLCTLFGLSPRFEEYRVVENWEKGLFYYAYRCIMKRNGRDVAESIGSANSYEKKYRTVSRKCPSCNAETIKRSKPRPNDKGEPGWYCWSKIGGCGANFTADDPAITEQKETVDPMAAADKINTLQKMAQKRAFVGAALLATNASEFFTQDVEDVAPVADSEIIDAEVTDPLEDGEKFLAEWDAVSRSHDLHPDIGRRVIMSAKLKQAKVERSADADLATRKKMLAEYKSATPEQIQQVKDLEEKKASGKNGAQPASTTTAGEPPITPELVKENKTFWAAAWQSADTRGISSDTFQVAIERANPTTPEQRTAILVAIRAGSFDFETGTVRRLETANA